MFGHGATHYVWMGVPSVGVSVGTSTTITCTLLLSTAQAVGRAVHQLLQQRRHAMWVTHSEGSWTHRQIYYDSYCSGAEDGSAAAGRAAKRWASLAAEHRLRSQMSLMAHES